MAAVAIYSDDPLLRRSLEELLRSDPELTVVGIVDDPSAVLPLIEQSPVDAVLAHAPPHAQLSDWRRRHPRIAFVVLIDGADEAAGLDALHAGADAILPRSAGRSDIVAAIEAADRDLAILPRGLVEAWLAASSPDPGEPPADPADGVALTPRELEVLAAMADGASNKAIARRLGISFHTAKFHVAAILGKLDADSRTEAVARAAHLGLVML
jgi:DNA-binding NarL/FixJ family response regulator